MNNSKETLPLTGLFQNLYSKNSPLLEKGEPLMNGRPKIYLEAASTLSLV